MKIKNVFLIIVSFYPLCINAQSNVTMIHNKSIMQQFLFMETGAGALEPRAYYNFFHKSYANNPIYIGGKLGYRTTYFALLAKERAAAKNTDSILKSRAKEEAKNLLNRKPGATDLAWTMEKGKIEGIQNIFQRNINKIMLLGGSRDSYLYWKHTYNMLQASLNETRDCYMDLGSRKTEYLAIYKDLVKKNQDLVKTLRQLAGIQSAKSLLGQRGTLKMHSSLKTIVYDAFDRWRNSLSAAGFSTKKDRLKRNQ